MLFDEYGEGSCINCGFLSQARVALNVTDFVEVPANMRASGNFGNDCIHCFVREANLHQDALSLGTPAVGAGRYRDECVRQVIEKRRNCPRWYPWSEGYGPKEHSDEQKARELEKDRRRYEERMEERRREFEEKHEERGQRFEKGLHAGTQQTQLEMARIANRQLKWTVTAIVVGIVVTVSATLVTVRCTENQVVVELPTTTAVPGVHMDTPPLP